MDEMETPYFHFAMNQSLANSDYFRALNLDDSAMVTLKEISEKSNLDRQAIEKSDTEDFESFLNRMNTD